MYIIYSQYKIDFIMLENYQTVFIIIILNNTWILCVNLSAEDVSTIKVNMSENKNIFPPQNKTLQNKTTKWFIFFPYLNDWCYLVMWQTVKWWAIPNELECKIPSK